jgi:hypothetical protein
MQDNNGMKTNADSKPGRNAWKLINKGTLRLMSPAARAFAGVPRELCSDAAIRAYLAKMG